MLEDYHREFFMGALLYAADVRSNSPHTWIDENDWPGILECKPKHLNEIKKRFTRAVQGSRITEEFLIEVYNHVSSMSRLQLAQPSSTYQYLHEVGDLFPVATYWPPVQSL